MLALTSKQGEDGFPALPQVHCGRKQQNFECSIDSVNSMVEELTERSTLMCSACLASVHSVKGLVQEQTNSPASIHPWRTVLVEGRCVPKHCEEVCNNEAEPGKGNLGLYQFMLISWGILTRADA